MNRIELTEHEKDALWDAIERAFLDTTTYSRASDAAVEEAVRRIVSDRILGLSNVSPHSDTNTPKRVTPQ